MFATFFESLRSAGVPVTLREYLTLLEAIEAGTAEYSAENFYHLARATLVKDERWFDRFDLVFATTFGDLLTGPDEFEIPSEWLRKVAEKYLPPDELERLSKAENWHELMKMLQERLKEQKERHQGGSKWIGTGGTSPFGAYGSHPEGIRIGQDRSRHRRAVKVWDKREFRDFDDQVELGTRNLRMALRKLRRFVRDGADDVLDVPGTIRSTADNAGHLKVEFEAERRNAIKVLLLLDVGGSMDDHVADVERLFSACRSEFKHLEVYYFHNCLYESVWRSNERRNSERTATWELLRTYPKDYVCVFVGDASMSPYEIAIAGASVEHFNEESGEAWLRRALSRYPKHVWINPLLEDRWRWYPSVQMIREITDDRMVPLTLAGIERAVDLLT